MRRIVHIPKENRFLPVSIYVIGVEGELIGIRVTSYNELTQEDKGFFLTLN